MNLSVPIAAVCSLFLLSCGKEEAKSEDTSQKENVKKHAHDWDPAEPDLVAGKVIYVDECALCHEEGEEGAPRLARASAWKEREAKGLETLLDHAINGFTGSDGEMPARGGSDYLTDEQVTNAVKFMLATSKS